MIILHGKTLPAHFANTAPGQSLHTNRKISTLQVVDYKNAIQ